MVQWLGLHVSTTVGAGLIPRPGIPQAGWENGGGETKKKTREVGKGCFYFGGGVLQHTNYRTQRHPQIYTQGKIFHFSYFSLLRRAAREFFLPLQLSLGKEWLASSGEVGNRAGFSRDGGAWWAAVYGVAQSQTPLKRLSSSSSTSFP